jgi:hypothetical protein
MLYDFPVPIQPENVHASPIGIARPFLPRMKNHLVAFRERSHKMDALARVLLRHPLEVTDKSLLSIFNHRIVLPIAIANIPFNGFARSALVEHQIVEALSRFLVLFGVHIWNGETLPPSDGNMPL